MTYGINSNVHTANKFLSNLEVPQSEDDEGQQDFVDIALCPRPQVYFPECPLVSLMF